MGVHVRCQVCRRHRADALVVGDAALRAGCSRQLLTSTLADCATWSDVERARKAVPLVSDLSESPLESLSRALMHEHGVPKPELQVSVLDGRYRVDFYWRKQRVVGEADGDNKYGEPGALFLEKVREDEIREEYGVVRWTYKQMVWDTDLTIARIMRKLAGR